MATSPISSNTPKQPEPTRETAASQISREAFVGLRNNLSNSAESVSIYPANTNSNYRGSFVAVVEDHLVQKLATKDNNKMVVILHDIDKIPNGREIADKVSAGNIGKEPYSVEYGSDKNQPAKADLVNQRLEKSDWVAKQAEAFAKQHLSPKEGAKFVENVKQFGEFMKQQVEANKTKDTDKQTAPAKNDVSRDK